MKRDDFYCKVYPTIFDLICRCVTLNELIYIKNDKNFYLQKFATDLFNSIEVKSFDLGKLISSPVSDSNFKEDPLNQKLSKTFRV
jgi:hypothetical protein